jgi:drug/metabolite transporter (DMT)-like permease
MTKLAPQLDGRGWALLLALALLWSVSFIFIKVAGAEIPILTLVLIRVGVAALVLHAYVRVRGLSFPRPPAVLARYGLMGLFNNLLPGALIVYATVRIGAGAASILNATVPMFTLVIAHATTADEKITPAKLTGILLGLLGAAAMMGPQAVQGLTGDAVAVGAMLLATFCYGLANTIGRSFSGIDPAISATCQLSAASLILAPFALLLDRPWSATMPSATALMAAAGLALASTALAYVLFFQLVERAGSTNTSLVTLLIPVSGIFLAWAVLGEAFTLDEAAGVALIALGLVVLDGRLLHRLSGRAAFRPDWRPGEEPDRGRVPSSLSASPSGPSRTPALPADGPVRG